MVREQTEFLKKIAHVIYRFAEEAKRSGVAIVMIHHSDPVYAPDSVSRGGRTPFFPSPPFVFIQQKENPLTQEPTCEFRILKSRGDTAISHRKTQIKFP